MCPEMSVQHIYEVPIVLLRNKPLPNFLVDLNDIYFAHESAM